MANVVTDLTLWLKENEKFFLPPVCNKLMHNEQLKVFYVGGPNQRKDFHLECGEEFFYQLKGDMNLIVLENGKFKDVIIKEGEVFLLPGKMLHSPQRNANTIGLVTERERLQEEKDCVRYFVGDSTETLFERWFYCYDLGSQLGPLIKEYFASEEHKTGKPKPEDITQSPPYLANSEIKVDEPFSLNQWIQENKIQIHAYGFKRLFSTKCNSDILVLGNGTYSSLYQNADTWLWQLSGSSNVLHNGNEILLKENQSVLLTKGSSVESSRKDQSLLLMVSMKPQ